MSRLGLRSGSNVFHGLPQKQPTRPAQASLLQLFPILKGVATLRRRVAEAVPRATTVHHSGIRSLMSGTSCRNSADQPLKRLAVPLILVESKL